MKIPAHIEEIIRAGIQAPSGDNCQPWAFKVNGDQVDLYLRPEVDQSFFNFRQLASVISCGAVLENMECAAARLGYAPEFEMDAKDDFSGPILRMYLNKTSRPHQDQKGLAPYVFNRCTNRKMYKTVPIEAETIDALRKEAARFPGCDLHVFEDRKDILRWARLVFMADRLRTERRDLHEHLMKMIRWTDEEALATRDGLPLKNLEAGLIGEMFLRATRPWKVMRVMNCLGVSRAVAFHSFKAMFQSGAVALMSVPDAGIKWFFEGGRAIERVWLRLTQMGLSMQPMTAITLFLTRYERERKAFSDNEARLLEKIKERLDCNFKGISDEYCFLFRIGVSSRPRKTTLRKREQDFLIKKEETNAPSK